MRHISVFLTLMLALTAGKAMAALPDQPAKDTHAEAVNAVNAFAIDLYAQLGSSKGNLFFSPYSISSALAMTWAGADGTTGKEMAGALHFGTVPDSLHNSMKALRERFDAIPAETGTLSVANRVWMAKETTLLPAYTALLKKIYDSDVAQLDFLTNPDGSRAIINSWVAEKTHDKIPELLQKEEIKPITRFVLTNAIYFNSEWSTPFRENMTKQEPFRTGAAKQKNVPMMHRTGFFLYGETPNLQLVKIPYRLPGFSLLVLLPRVTKDFRQLEALEKLLSLPELNAWTAKMERRNVALQLPKFKDEERYGMKEILQKLGINLAFSPNADFSKMTEKNDVRIDTVIHKAIIELDEKGTEAAAATAVIMELKSVRAPDPVKPIVFRADHPFIYCITDDLTGTILFMGRMAEPQK